MNIEEGDQDTYYLCVPNMLCISLHVAERHIDDLFVWFEKLRNSNVFVCLCLDTGMKYILNSFPNGKWKSQLITGQSDFDKNE